jgi:hypothetical protein
MDLEHHIRVWWRWRALLGAGLLLAVTVAVLVTFKPTFSGGPDLKWRGSATYTSTSRLFVTQPGFPWGRATLPGLAPGGVADPAVKGESFATPDRFANLALVYSYIAQSDLIRKLISPEPLVDQITVSTPSIPGSSDPLPLLEIAAKATEPRDAQRLNEGAIEALRGYLNTELDANSVKAQDRVQLQVLNPPLAGELTGGRSMTLSFVAFLLEIVAALFLVYVLETLRRGRADAATADGEFVVVEDGTQELEDWTSVPTASSSRVA